jgi:tyrosinase
MGRTLLQAVTASLGLFSLFPASVTASPLVERQTLTADQIAAQALANAYKVLNGTLQDGMTHTACTKDKLQVRREYGDLSKEERSEYIRAVKCLLTKPSKLSATTYPGAKSRYDDFVVVHMNMTPSVHGTANFMHWHRYYIWAYESALKTECEFKGTQPYWNWGKYQDLTTSPIFSGDDWSLGGNGDPVQHKGGFVGRQIPAGPGGGCVTKGPFANLTIHLGPLSSTIDPALGVKSNPRRDGYGDNPRCLRRDVNNYFVTQYLRPADIASHITSNKAIGTFQDTLQNDTPTKAALHSGGHFSIWGDPGGDVYVSPGEPAFWLHHGQLDRHWWMWQNYVEAEVAKRTSMYEGGTNWMQPNSAKGKVTDKQWLSVVAPAGMDGVASSQIFSTVGGPFCYVYV